MVTLTVLSPQGSGHLGLVLPQWLEDRSRAVESEPHLLLADWVPSDLWGLQKGLAHSRGSVNVSFFLLSPLPTCHPQPVFTITAPSLFLSATDQGLLYHTQSQILDFLPSKMCAQFLGCSLRREAQHLLQHPFQQKTLSQMTQRRS